MKAYRCTVEDEWNIYREGHTSKRGIYASKCLQIINHSLLNYKRIRTKYCYGSNYAQQLDNFYLIFSKNSEAFTSEFLENNKEMISI